MLVQRRQISLSDLMLLPMPACRYPTHGSRMNDLSIPMGLGSHILWLFGNGEGFTDSQAPRLLPITHVSPVYVSSLHVAQAAGLRAGQQEHVSLEWGGWG